MVGEVLKIIFLHAESQDVEVWQAHIDSVFVDPLLAEQFLVKLPHSGDLLLGHASGYVLFEGLGPVLLKFFPFLPIVETHTGYLHSDFGFLDDRNQMGWGTWERTEPPCGRDCKIITGIQKGRSRPYDCGLFMMS